MNYQRELKRMTGKLEKLEVDLAESTSAAMSVDLKRAQVAVQHYIEALERVVARIDKGLAPFVPAKGPKKKATKKVAKRSK